MQCECRSTLEDRLREKVRGQLPEGARSFSGHLEGYAFIMGEGSSLGMQPVSAIKMGRKAIAVELKESYWNLAVRNLQDAQAAPMDMSAGA